MTFDMTLFASFAAGLCALCAFLSVADIFNEISLRYKERYIREASTELNDVLWELPPERIFSISMTLSAIAALLAGGYVFLTSAPPTELIDGEVIGGFSWLKFIFFTVISAFIAFPMPRIYLRIKRRQRLDKFNEQLVDGLNSMSSALRAGFSINQSMEALADEKMKPLSDEFSILVREIRLGVPLDEALQKMNQRLGSEDFELVSAAVITARQTGGELTQVLERLAAMIRERLRINGRIRALTAQGKLQAYIIGAMPYLLLIAMSFVAEDMTSAFYNSPIGIGVLVAVTALVVIGFLAIKKITSIDV